MKHRFVPVAEATEADCSALPSGSLSLSPLTPHLSPLSGLSQLLTMA
ncbi:MAG TPA: hypothetical protein VFZ87_03320 [Gemmatimonadales bacterium]